MNTIKVGTGFNVVIAFGAYSDEMRFVFNNMVLESDKTNIEFYVDANDNLRQKVFDVLSSIKLTDNTPITTYYDGAGITPFFDKSFERCFECYPYTHFCVYITRTGKMTRILL